MLYRPVPGYTDLYAGMDGTIIYGGRGTLHRYPDSRGYLRVYVPKIGKKKVHQLVAAAFLGPNKTECPQGHPYTPENTYTPPGTNSRLCRTCMADRVKEYDARPENKARRRDYQREYQRKWREKNRDKHNEYSRRSRKRAQSRTA